jgi:hypothetical protein
MLNPLIVALSVSAPAAAAQAVAPPIACRADALDTAQRRRQQDLLETVRGKALGVHELPDGLALSFPPDAPLFLDLAEWISLERRCCPFLAFALEWSIDDSVVVRLTGQPGVGELIAAEMGVSLDR